MLRQPSIFATQLPYDLAAYVKVPEKVFRINRCAPKTNEEPISLRTSLKYLTL